MGHGGPPATRGVLSPFRHRTRNVRIVVITADRYNPLHGLVAPLRERAAPDPSPTVLAPLGRADWPTRAVVDLSRLRPLDPNAITGSAGQLSEATLRSVSEAVPRVPGPRRLMPVRAARRTVV